MKCLHICKTQKPIYGKDGVLEMADTNKTQLTTEAWLPIKGISNGMITTPTGNVVGVKIQPRNIFILDQNDQERVLMRLKDFYNEIDFDFWLFAIDKPVDIKVFLSQLQVQLNNQQHPMIAKMIREDLEKAEMFMRNEVIDTEYYLLFKEKNPDIIAKRIRSLIGSLLTAGLQAAQASNEDLRTVLDAFLNDGKTTELRMVLPR